MLHLLSFEAGHDGVGSAVRTIQRLVSGFAVRDRLSICLGEEFVDKSFGVHKNILPVALHSTNQACLKLVAKVMQSTCAACGQTPIVVVPVLDLRENH